MVKINVFHLVIDYFTNDFTSENPFAFTAKSSKVGEDKSKTVRYSPINLSRVLNRK